MTFVTGSYHVIVDRGWSVMAERMQVGGWWGGGGGTRRGGKFKCPENLLKAFRGPEAAVHLNIVESTIHLITTQIFYRHPTTIFYVQTIFASRHILYIVFDPSDR